MSKLSELLRREIWSERTAKIASVGFLLLALSGFGWVWLYWNWVTPLERYTAKTALREIQELRDPQIVKSATYSNLIAEARQEVGKCNSRAILPTDRSVAWDLHTDLEATVTAEQLQQSPDEYAEALVAVGQNKQKVIAFQEWLGRSTEERIEKNLGIKKN